MVSLGVFLQRFIFIRLILDLFGVVFSILYLLRTVGKVAIFVGNCYAYIGFRRRGYSGCGDDKSVTAVFCSRIHDFIRWRRFSAYTEKYIN